MHIEETSLQWHPDDSGIRQVNPRRGDCTLLEVPCPAPQCGQAIQFDYYDAGEQHDCDCGEGRMVLV
jgi:hypothetical protein